MQSRQEIQPMEHKFDNNLFREKGLVFVASTANVQGEPEKVEEEGVGIEVLADQIQEKHGGSRELAEKLAKAEMALAQSIREKGELALLARTAQEKAQLAEEIAKIDKLTGVANRLPYELKLENEINRIERAKKPVSLLLIDIDHFKKFNDKYGHKTGDMVLRDVAHIIQENLPRKVDMVARYGGEEFAVILPETDSKGASVVAERLRMAIEEKTKEKNLPVTISVGHATFDVEGKEIDSIEKLEMAADTALYQSKKDGRNRVTTFEKGMKMPTSIEKLSKKLLCAQHDLIRLLEDMNKEKRIFEIIEQSNKAELVDYSKEKIASLEDQIKKTEIEIQEVEKAIETEKMAVAVA